jgi:hypothetical protein
MKVEMDVGVRLDRPRLSTTPRGGGGAEWSDPDQSVSVDPAGSDPVRSACRASPRVPRVVGQAIRCERDNLLMAELLGSHLEVAFVAEVAGVVVLVAASKGKRLDVVDDGRELHAVTSLAQLAKAG